MYEYDEYFTMVNRSLTNAEINKADPQKALQEAVIQNLLDRLDDREGKNNIDQLIGCSLEKVEAKGSKYMEWFMDSSRLNYRDYPEEVKQLIKTFETQTEMIVFFVQILNMIRHKKTIQARSNNGRWNDLLSGI